MVLHFSAIASLNHLKEQSENIVKNSKKNSISTNIVSDFCTTSISDKKIQSQNIQDNRDSGKFKCTLNHLIEKSPVPLYSVFLLHTGEHHLGWVQQRTHSFPALKRMAREV